MNTKLFSPRRVARMAAVLSLAILPASVVLAQTPTLAEIARKEQERRKTLKSPARVYTNKDLPAPAAPLPAAALPPATSSAAAKPAAEQKEEQKKEQKDEAWWRARMTEALEEVRRNELFAEALQTRINSLSADVINRDDPAQRAKLSDDRQKAVAELGRVKTEIEQGKKKIADIEEEARVAAVPPGWIR